MIMLGTHNIIIFIIAQSNNIFIDIYLYIGTQQAL